MGRRKKGKGGGRKKRAAMTRSASENPTKKANAASEEQPESSDETHETIGDESEDAADDEGVAAEDQDERDEPTVEEERTSRAAKVASPADSEPPPSTAGTESGADWALPLVRLERRWTWIEVRLMFASLTALMVVLVFWAGIASMADSVESTVVKGTLFRMIVGASVLGGVTRAATRSLDKEWQRSLATVVAVAVGVGSAFYWRSSGIVFFAGVYDWLEKGSVFSLFGGPNGLSTRLAMFTSIVGGSLAAAAGTHIAIDAIVRLVPQKLRKPAAVTTACSTTLVCVLAAWGFFDHVVVTSMGAQADMKGSEKITHALHETEEHFFLLRKQMKLDLIILPRVLDSQAWNAPGTFTGRDWNEFIDANGFAERYGEEVSRVRAAESSLDSDKQPVVKTPDGQSAGVLLHSFDMMWAWGFLMIGLRFLLRAVLLIAGHVSVNEMDSDDASEPAVEGAS
jgi:TRAP-type C4-dicarboxylate transport system permease small subunit